MGINSPGHVEDVAKYADILLIGPLNMENYFLLVEASKPI